jgi:hypothetical protein
MKIISGHTGRHCPRKGNKMNNLPAFPAMHFDLADNEHGLTIRDYFAAKVMQAMLGSNWTLKEEEIPARAYKMADMMMKAREQG